MNKIRILFFALSLTVGGAQARAQAHLMPAQKTFRVAIFAPLYLDSVFENGTLKNDKSIPRFIVPGIDFVQGAMVAFDSMNLQGKKVEAHIFDVKANAKSVEWQINNKQLDSMDLIIGSVREPEYGHLARFAFQKDIPFVSATFPNSGGMRGNTRLLIVNPTLKSHVEAIYSYLLQKHGEDNIYLFKKKNDNRIENYFSATNTVEGKELLKIKVIPLDSSVSTYGLRNLIDTSRQVVIIGASLEETFSSKLADAIYPIEKNNPLIYIGMPNWDGFTCWYNTSAYTGFPIRYTTPHYLAKNNIFKKYIQDKYFQLYNIEPSDMVEKGFGITYNFTSILIHHPEMFMQNINDTTYAPFHDFNFRPVSNGGNAQIDYYENKHLFIMQILNGEISREW